MDDGSGGSAPSLIEASAYPDDAAAWAAVSTPGSAVVMPLTVLDPYRLSAAGRVDALTALERQIAWLQARQLRLLAVMANRPDPATPLEELDRDWVREDVAAALRLSAGTAADRLELARELTRLPATVALLERGGLTIHHARALAEAVRSLDDQTTTTVETEVLAKAAGATLAKFRRAIAWAVLATSSARAEESHARAIEGRKVTITPTVDGMAELWALLPADGAAALKSVVDRAAAAYGADDVRTTDQRRADALVDLVVDAGAGSAGAKPLVQVTVAISTLLGTDDQPGMLDGHGPIPASLARKIAADPSGTWRRLVTDSHGQLLDYGRTAYTPPANLDDHVRTRDGTCRFPTCNRPARLSHLDHITAWEDDGPTSEANLHALCARHHRMKHRTRWRVHRNPDGATRWQSPTGHHYVTPATTLPIDRTAAVPDDPDPPF